MKNRRLIIVSFVLVAAMVVGVGYAALTDTLVIGGNIEVERSVAVNALNNDIYFTENCSMTLLDDAGNSKATPADALFNIARDPTDTSNDTLKFTVEKVFTSVGEQVKIVAEITNTGENTNQAAVLSISTATANGDEYFRAVSKTFSTSSTSNSDVTTDGLPAGETCTVTIIFELYNLPTSGEKVACSVTYNLIATIPDAETAAETTVE